MTILNFHFQFETIHLSISFPFGSRQEQPWVLRHPEQLPRSSALLSSRCVCKASSTCFDLVEMMFSDEERRSDEVQVGVVVFLQVVWPGF